MKLLGKSLEKLDVLGFLARELQIGAGAQIVRIQLRARMVHDEGQDELFDQPEHVEIAVAADLVEDPLLASAQEAELVHAGERFRHEPPAEIQPMLAADNIVDLPVNAL